MQAKLCVNKRTGVAYLRLIPTQVADEGYLKRLADRDDISIRVSWVTKEGCDCGHILTEDTE